MAFPYSVLMYLHSRHTLYKINPINEGGCCIFYTLLPLALCFLCWFYQTRTIMQCLNEIRNRRLVTREDIVKLRPECDNVRNVTNPVSLECDNVNQV